jgi:hypothetical protein
LLDAADSLRKLAESGYGVPNQIAMWRNLLRGQIKADRWLVVQRFYHISGDFLFALFLGEMP